jgi:hypothetical protein
VCVSVLSRFPPQPTTVMICLSDPALHLMPSFKCSGLRIFAKSTLSENLRASSPRLCPRHRFQESQDPEQCRLFPEENGRTYYRQQIVDIECPTICTISSFSVISISVTIELLLVKIRSSDITHPLYSVVYFLPPCSEALRSPFL